MQVQQKAVFSPSGEYFAFPDCQGVLKILDTASDTVKKQHALLSVNHSCSSLTWSPAKEMVLLCSDDDLIRECVALLPLDCLKAILSEMQNRLLDEDERYIYSSRKWLKEILNHNLQVLRKRKDMEDNLNQIKDFIDKQRVNETLVKLTKLKGLLNLQRIKHRSVGYSDKDME